MSLFVSVTVREHFLIFVFNNTKVIFSIRMPRVTGVFLWIYCRKSPYILFFYEEGFCLLQFSIFKISILIVIRIRTQWLAGIVFCNFLFEGSINQFLNFSNFRGSFWVHLILLKIVFGVKLINFKYCMFNIIYIWCFFVVTF